MSLPLELTALHLGLVCQTESCCLFMFDNDHLLRNYLVKYLQ